MTTRCCCSRERRQRFYIQIDTLNQFEHWWATPVQFVLLLFGLANAGVPFEHVGPGTYFVLAGLLLGKPGGAALAETKMGALLSFSAAPLALVASRLLRGRAV